MGKEFAAALSLVADSTAIAAVPASAAEATNTANVTAAMTSAAKFRRKLWNRLLSGG
jgi:hypothetical protein